MDLVFPDEKRLKKAVLVTAVDLIVAAMLATPLSTAVPLTYPKNSDKFEEFTVTGTFSLLSFILGEHEYIPSFEKVNKLIITFAENWLTLVLS